MFNSLEEYLKSLFFLFSHTLILLMHSDSFLFSAVYIYHQYIVLIKNV